MNTRSGKQPLVSPLSDPEKSFSKRKKKALKKSKNPLENNFRKNVVNVGTSNLFEEKVVFEKKNQPPSINMAGPIDRINQPMWNRQRTVAPIPGSAIVKPELGDNFIVKGNHMKMIQENQFDGRFLSDPYKHIANFEEICEMFKYGRDLVEHVKLRFFPLSLTGEAKLWFNGLEEGSIDSWDEMKKVFANRFFPHGLQQKLFNDVRTFKQYEKENFIDAWIRLQKLLKKCYGHDLDKEEIVNIFYNGLDDNSQILLDVAGGGIFLYKSAIDAYQIMEDKMMMRMSKSTAEEGKSKAVSFVKAKEESSKMEAKFDNMMNLFSNNFNILEKEMNDLKNGYSHGVDNHMSEECDTSGFQEEANYLQNNNQGNNQRGWGQNRNQGNFDTGFYSHTNNFPTRYPRNNQNFQNQPNQNFQNQPNQNFQNQQPPNKDAFTQQNQKSGEDTTLTSIEKTLKDFISFQKDTNDQFFKRFDFLQNNQEQSLHNQQASINDLEKKLDRLSDKNVNRPTGSLPSNTQPNPRPSTSNSNQNQKYQPPPVRNEQVNAISTRTGNNYGANIDSAGPTDSPKLVPEPEDDDFTDNESVDEEIETEPNPTKKTTTVPTEPVDKPPLKAYKPKIPYPQRLRKERRQDMANFLK